MSDAADSPDGGDVQPTMEQAAISPDGDGGHTPPPSLNGGSPAEAARSFAVAQQQARPELIIGAAFAGGFALAILLRRLGR